MKTSYSFLFLKLARQTRSVALPALIIMFAGVFFCSACLNAGDAPPPTSAPAPEESPAAPTPAPPAVETLRVSRASTAIETPPAFEGVMPDMERIEGTSLEYALNSTAAVVRVPDGAWFTCENGVWFTAEAAHGPWRVATAIPSDIGRIPKNHPAGFLAFARLREYDGTYVWFEIDRASYYASADPADNPADTETTENAAPEIPPTIAAPSAQPAPPVQYNYTINNYASPWWSDYSWGIGINSGWWGISTGSAFWYGAPFGVGFYFSPWYSSWYYSSYWVARPRHHYYYRHHHHHPRLNAGYVRLTPPPRHGSRVVIAPRPVVRVGVRPAIVHRPRPVVVARPRPGVVRYNRPVKLAPPSPAHRPFSPRPAQVRPPQSPVNRPGTVARPSPRPVTRPSPAPNPVTRPATTPRPVTRPAPAPNPVTRPATAPSPRPVTRPAPSPRPVTRPSPAPAPAPVARPAPAPAPAPRVEPSRPAPTPDRSDSPSTSRGGFGSRRH